MFNQISMYFLPQFPQNSERNSYNQLSISGDKYIKKQKAPVTCSAFGLSLLFVISTLLTQLLTQSSADFIDNVESSFSAYGFVVFIPLLPNGSISCSHCSLLLISDQLCASNGRSISLMQLQSATLSQRNQDQNNVNSFRIICRDTELFTPVLQLFLVFHSFVAVAGKAEDGLVHASRPQSLNCL